jgi:hypothetical protein
MKWPPLPIPTDDGGLTHSRGGKHSYTWDAEIVTQPSEENLNAAGMSWRHQKWVSPEVLTGLDLRALGHRYETTTGILLQWASAPFPLYLETSL